MNEVGVAVCRRLRKRTNAPKRQLDAQDLITWRHPVFEAQMGDAFEVGYVVGHQRKIVGKG